VVFSVRINISLTSRYTCLFYGRSKFGICCNEISVYRKLVYCNISVLWRIDALLGNDRGTNNEKTAVARQRPARQWTREQCFLRVPRRWLRTQKWIQHWWAVFSALSVWRGHKRERFRAKRMNTRGLNFAAVKSTTIQVSNCRFWGLNKLRHRLLHNPALADITVYIKTKCQVIFC
jgi:hypothetical protein